MPVETNDMERTPYVAETLRVRCPSCRKLYLVQFSDIQEAKPRFECVQCRSRFWLSLPDMDLSGEVTGLPVQMREVPAPARARKPASAPARAPEPCPKCFKPIAAGASECAHCGVMIEKARTALSFQENGPARTATLEALWKKIIEDYGNEELHAEFLRAASQERLLPYAAAQYAQMQKLMPTDELTKRKLREVQALGGALVPAAREKRLVGRRFGRLWQVPLLAAILMIVVGLSIPFFRNLVGVGAAFLFLAVALQMQLGRRS